MPDAEDRSGPFARLPDGIETERLTLRTWVPQDTGWHRRLVAERGEGAPSAGDDAAVIAQAIGSWRDSCLAPYVVRRRDGSEPVGYVGLVVGRSTAAEPELAYELFGSAHGNGVATEAARAVVDAVARTGRARLWSTVRPWHTASFRVLQKLGFRRDRVTVDARGEIVWSVLELGAP